MKTLIPINTTAEGIFPTIKANYYKMGGANFCGHKNDGTGFGAVPAVMEIYDEDTITTTFEKPSWSEGENENLHGQ